MYDLRLSAEQLEFRDTVRDFVEHEMKPRALAPARLEPFDKPLLLDVLDKAARVGLRTLSLSETAGGAGADLLTACIVMEELAAGDVDVASALSLTSGLAHLLFDELMTEDQRKRLLPDFLEDDRYHLAVAPCNRSGGHGWHYHRASADAAELPAAMKHGKDDWVVDGGCAFVPNAPVARLFAVDVQTENGVTTMLVSRETPGLTVSEPVRAFGAAALRGNTATRWYHGTGAAIELNECRVPDMNRIEHSSSPAQQARSTLFTAALNLGLGRAAYEAAVDYAKIRVQGGRPIVEHQAIGTILADSTIRLELARNMVWKAAWALDHPDAIADRSIPDLPLHTIARVYTAQAVNEVALGAAECFGAMGVMRDMPLQKYVHDSFIFLHAADHDSATKLAIAEAVAGFERPLAAA